jgi:hypothetical protein
MKISLAIGMDAIQNAAASHLFAGETIRCITTSLEEAAPLPDLIGTADKTAESATFPASAQTHEEKCNSQNLAF